MENSNTFAVRKAIGKIVRLYCNSPKNNFVAKVVSFFFGNDTHFHWSFTFV